MKIDSACLFPDSARPGTNDPATGVDSLRRLRGELEGFLAQTQFRLEAIAECLTSCQSGAAIDQSQAAAAYQQLAASVGMPSAPSYEPQPAASELRPKDVPFQADADERPPPRPYGMSGSAQVSAAISKRASAPSEVVPSHDDESFAAPAASTPPAEPEPPAVAPQPVAEEFLPEYQPPAEPVPANDQVTQPPASPPASAPSLEVSQPGEGAFPDSAFGEPLSADPQPAAESPEPAAPEPAAPEPPVQPPAPPAASDRPDLEDEVDPTDRLAAIKARLAKQMENF